MPRVRRPVLDGAAATGAVHARRDGSTAAPLLLQFDFFDLPVHLPRVVVLVVIVHIEAISNRTPPLAHAFLASGLEFPVDTYNRSIDVSMVVPVFAKQQVDTLRGSSEFTVDSITDTPSVFKYANVPS